MLSHICAPIAVLFVFVISTIAVGERPNQRRCSYDTAEIRREWGDLNLRERRDYIDAVLCMQNLPPVSNLPGTKSHFDDFVAVHINMSLSIHLDGIFFHWHREFVQKWETALRTKCGYNDYQPYWNWALWPDLANSPLFDGSETSLGGDGKHVAGRAPYIVNGNYTIPVGTGGGCVLDGPFMNMSLNMGPFDQNDIFTGLPANWSDYTGPQCLLRDLNNPAITTYNSQAMIDLVLAQSNIGDMSTFMNSRGGIELGPHWGGHLSLGPTLLDFFGSPMDPAFFLHHGMVDRVWTMWQAVDPVARRYQYNGTSTIFNAPDTPEVNNDTTLFYGVLGDTITVKETVDPMNGRYCYRYV